MNLYDMLQPIEKAYHDALVGVVNAYGAFDQGTQSVWVGYEGPEENEKASIGVKCGNCSFHVMTENGQMGCKIVSFLVDPEGYCRLAAIPDGLVVDKAVEAEDVEKQAPCWEGYVQRGMKPKDGKMVPNCVPVESKASKVWEGSAFNFNKS